MTISAASKRELSVVVPGGKAQDFKASRPNSRAIRRNSVLDQVPRCAETEKGGLCVCQIVVALGFAIVFLESFRERTRKFGSEVSILESKKLTFEKWLADPISAKGIT